MIEFKSECGHTVRARDEDAGKAVRCSYCGQSCQVPEERAGADGLDSLFEEVEKTGVFDAESTKAGQKAFKAARKGPRRGGRNAGFDPFAIALKMTYVAVGIILVAIILTQVVPRLRGAYRSVKTAWASPSPAPTSAPTPPASGGPSEPGKFGLINRSVLSGVQGVYVTSVPPGAMVYLLNRSWDGKSSILEERSADQNKTTPCAVATNKAGSYTVAIALRIADEALKAYPHYEDFRTSVEAEKCDATRLREFLVPDGATATRVEKFRRAWYLVRIYEVSVYEGLWSPATALFLPRLPADQLVAYVPKDRAYTPDPKDAQSELNYYKVPAIDQTYIINALERVGAMVYRRNETESYRLFQVDPKDGKVLSEECRD